MRSDQANYRVGRYERDDVGTEMFGILDRRDTDTACRARHRYALTGLNLCAHRQCDCNRCEGCSNRCGFAYIN
jgi:hypothetical protein